MATLAELKHYIGYYKDWGVINRKTGEIVHGVPDQQAADHFALQRLKGLNLLKVIQWFVKKYQDNELSLIYRIVGPLTNDDFDNIVKSMNELPIVDTYSIEIMGYSEKFGNDASNIIGFPKDKFIRQLRAFINRSPEEKPLLIKNKTFTTEAVHALRYPAWGIINLNTGEVHSGDEENKLPVAPLHIDLAKLHRLPIRDTVQYYYAKEIQNMLTLVFRISRQTSLADKASILRILLNAMKNLPPADLVHLEFFDGKERFDFHSKYQHFMNKYKQSVLKEDVHFIDNYSMWGLVVVKTGEIIYGEEVEGAVTHDTIRHIVGNLKPSDTIEFFFEKDSGNLVFRFNYSKSQDIKQIIKMTNKAIRTLPSSYQVEADIIDEVNPNKNTYFIVPPQQFLQRLQSTLESL